MELYQQIRCSENPPNPTYQGGKGGISADNSIEQSELQLSGLVTRREGKLIIYSAIYKLVFDENWVENELKNLRPYSESFKYWVASGGKDESRLLRGKALVGAEEWAKDKNLSYQDRQFLAASREKEIQEKIAVEEREAQLERERKDKEAVEKRNLVLSEANRKAKRRIRNGTVVLSLALSFTAISSFVAANKVREARKTHEYLQTVEKLTKMAGELEDEGSDSDAKELFSQAGQSVNIKDHKLKLAVLYTGISYAHQKLKSKDLLKAQHYLKLSQQQWEYLRQNSSNEALQIRLLTLKTQANLFQQQEKPQKAIIAKYEQAFGILNKLKEKRQRGGRLAEISPAFNPRIKIKILSKQNLEALHREFITLLSKNDNKNLKSQVKESLKEHYLDELNNLLANKKWREANIRTYRLMVYVANREHYLDTESIKNFSCKSLQNIDSLWLQHSDRRFGFSVQKKVWLKTGNRLGITSDKWTKQDEENFLKFMSEVGWYNLTNKTWKREVDIFNLTKNYSTAPLGTLPTPLGTPNPYMGCTWCADSAVIFFSRCDL